MSASRAPWALMRSVGGIQVDRVNLAGSESGQQSNFASKGDDGFQTLAETIDRVEIADADRPVPRKLVGVARADAARGRAQLGLVAGSVFGEGVFAGAHRLNGNGELTGLEWIREAGVLAGPIGITNTHSVGVVRDAIVADLTSTADALFPPELRPGPCR